MSQSKLEQKLADYLSYMVAAVLMFLPLHAFITTWAGSNFGHLDLWRIWKELIIVVIFAPTIWVAVKNQIFKNWLKESWLAKSIVAYLVLNLALGIWAVQTSKVNDQALIYGWLSDLRFLGIFMICVCLSLSSQILTKNWWKIALIPSVIVVVFGFLQLFLPLDFLKHFGYGPKTIPAYQTIDQKLAYRRIQSTLRGANPLGAYLVMITTILLGYKTRKVFKYFLIVLTLVGLFFSYSRSAWLGMIVSLAALFIYTHKNWYKYKTYFVLAGVFAVILGGLALVFRHSPRVENTLFHTDTTSQSKNSSNASRLTALEDASIDVVTHPIGQGPGTAGPASTRNNHEARLAENYFLQVGQETGWLGLILFLVISALLAWEFWMARSDRRAQVMLAALIGLSAVNMLSHAWADDTLGLLFWGLAGVIVADAILNKKRKHNGITKKST